MLKLLFDVYPMRAERYSGIPQMTWNLVREFLNRDVDCIYSFGNIILFPELLYKIIYDRSGKFFTELVRDHCLANKINLISGSIFKKRIYFSPHMLSFYSKYFLGCSKIIHDLSSMTLSQFHTKDVIENDAKKQQKESAICDLIFTVSNSSKMEIIKYLGLEPEKVIVSYPGVGWTDAQIENSFLLLDKPYIIILATREPRKNLNLVYQYLIAKSQDILEGEQVYAFAGISGWGEDINVEIKRGIKKLLEAGKIIHLGYVPEELKLSLLAGARYMIFPSYFEGFGSPVAEALAAGTPVVCSIGGSLPEIGGNVVKYFSPLSVQSLAEAIERMELTLLGRGIEYRKKAISQTSDFTWKRCADIILENLESLYERKTFGSVANGPGQDFVKRGCFESA